MADGTSKKVSLKRVDDACCPKPAARKALFDAAKLVPVLKALADETRVQIVVLLADAKDELCACDIEAHFDLSQPTISHHMKVLRTASVVDGEKRGLWMYYRLQPDALEALQKMLARTLR